METYADANGITVRTEAKQLDGNLREFLKHYSWELTTVEGNRLFRRKRTEALMWILKTATSTWTLPSDTKTFISVNRR